jgi:hypothetical protein
MTWWIEASSDSPELVSEFREVFGACSDEHEIRFDWPDRDDMA